MANDVSILAGFVTFFLILAVALPILQSEFNQDVNSYDTDTLQQMGDAPSDSWFNSSFTLILTNLFVFPFWTFGAPWWINLTFLLAIRMLLVFLIYRAIRSGGG